MSLNKYSEILKGLNSNKQSQLTPNSKVLIIDGLNQFIRAYTANPATNDDGIHIGGISGFLTSIGYAIKQFKPTRVILVFDGNGGSKRRKEIYPEYKANRKANPKAPRFNRKHDFQTKEQEDASMSYQFGRLLEYIECLPIEVITIDHIEADDTIAYVSKQFRESKKIIMSTDKDFLQLVNEDTSVWSPTKKKHYTQERVLEEWGVPPQNIIWYRIIDGDKSDNIPGIKGWGPKKILKNVGFLKNTTICNIDEFIGYTNKIPNLNESEDILERNYKLMTLADTNISGNNKSKILDFINSERNRLVKFKFQKMILEDKLYTLKNPTVWLSTCFRDLDAYASKHNKGE